ncbi:MAG: glycerate kinase [Candidatus Cloacimonetes bacterium]|nr:glycerate kinase [Candidatus Cloacimonadota bacterium]
MKIIIAPDSFKGSLTSFQVANAIGKGFLKVLPKTEIVKIPMSDGGEGTIKCLIEATEGKYFKEYISNPLGKRIEAEYGVLGEGKTAIIEMASVSGIMLIPKEKQNPLYTTTFGTGELIRKVLQRGYKKIILGLGGSATTDGGAGALQALGAKLLDSKGKNINPGGLYLKKLDKIDISGIDKNVKNTELILMCDVNNALFGPKGAARVYSSQKGASLSEVELLERNLSHFVKIIKKDIGKDISNIPGTGAAGGLGAGLSSIFNTEFKSGIEVAIEITELSQLMENTNLVITGEGELNFQTLYGKVPIGVAKLAKKKDIPVIVFVGNFEKYTEKLYTNYFDKIISLTSSKIAKEEAMENAYSLLATRAGEVAKLYKEGVLFET